MSSEIEINGTSLCYCRDALGIYKDYLAKRNRKGNPRIEKDLSIVSAAHRSIMSEFNKRHAMPNLQDWMTMSFNVSDASCQLLKALLPVLKRKYELEKEQAINKGEPPEALEHIDVYIAKVVEIMGWDFLQEVVPHTLIGHDQLLMREEQPQTPAGTVIINNHDGIVAFGDHNIIVQEHYANASKELQKLIEAVRKSELSEADKRETEAEIITIEAQLSKPKPDKTIIKRAYASLKGVLVGGELLGLAINVHAVLHAMGLI